MPETHPDAGRGRDVEPHHDDAPAGTHHARATADLVTRPEPLPGRRPDEVEIEVERDADRRRELGVGELAGDDVGERRKTDGRTTSVPG